MHLGYIILPRKLVFAWRMKVELHKFIFSAVNNHRAIDGELHSMSEILKLGTTGIRFGLKSERSAAYGALLSGYDIDGRLITSGGA